MPLGVWNLRQAFGVDVDLATPPATIDLGVPATLTATTGSVPVTGPWFGGSYIFSAVFTGTSLKLQALAPNGTNWYDLATLTASGRATVVLGNNETVRVYNSNGASVTGISVSLT